MWTNQFGCGDRSMIFSHGKSDARGVLISFREAIKYKIKARYMDKNGQYIVLDVLIDKNPVIRVNYYAPNIQSDQLKVLDELAHMSINYKFQKMLHLAGVGISICFLMLIWMQMEDPLNSKSSHFPNFFL